MIKSMTGYGAGKHSENGQSFSVEIKSVNHRYFDLSVKLPRTMLAFEEPVRKRISSQISRGKIDAYVNFESTAAEDNSVFFNEALGDNLYAELSKIKERYGFEEEINLSMLYRFPNVLALAKKDSVEHVADGELWKILEIALGNALESFVIMRSKEGEAIKRDMNEKIAAVADITYEIERKAPSVVTEHKEKLEARLKEILTEQVDEQRLMYEVAIFADKSSVDEELTRLKSHIKQFGSILDEDIPSGKKLDFLVQEMLRETNTIGSKSNNLDITRNVIRLKSEIEKIREQIQNVE